MLRKGLLFWSLVTWTLSGCANGYTSLIRVYPISNRLLRMKTPFLCSALFASCDSITTYRSSNRKCQIDCRGARPPRLAVGAASLVGR